MRKSLIILGILEDRDLEWLIENGSGRRLQVGDYLLRQGRKVEAMYFLLAGRLGVELEIVIGFGQRDPAFEQRRTFVRGQLRAVNRVAVAAQIVERAGFDIA